MAMNVLLSGAVVGYVVHTSCELIDAHRERRKRQWRQVYEKAEKKKNKKATHHHHHYHLEGRTPKYIDNRPYWQDYEYEKGQAGQQYYDQYNRHGPADYYHNQRDNRRINDQFTDNAGLLESGQLHDEQHYRRRALPSPETIVTNAAEQDTTAVPPQPNSYDPKPSSTQQSRTMPTSTNHTHSSHRSPSANDIASMTYKQLQDLQNDPTIDEDSRKAVRRRIMEWQMFMMYYQQQQNQQQPQKHPHYQHQHQQYQQGYYRQQQPRHHYPPQQQVRQAV